MKLRFKINTKVNVGQLFKVSRVSIVRLFFYTGLLIAILGAITAMVYVALCSLLHPHGRHVRFLRFSC